MRDRSGIVRAQCGHSAGTVRAPRERCTFGMKCGCLRWASNTRKSPLGLPGAHSLSEPPSSMLPPPAARSRAHRCFMSPTAARTVEGDVATAVRRRRFRNSSFDSFLLVGQEPSRSRMRWLTQRLMERILHVRDQRPACHARLGLAQTHTKTPRPPRPQCWYWLPAAFATCKIVSSRAGGGNCAVALAILSPGRGREGFANLRGWLLG